MNMEIEVRNQAYLIFNTIENASCDFAEKLLELGIDRVIGRALCMEWASAKHGTRIVQGGQRGPALPAGSAAQKAFSRVCLFVWPAESATPSKAKRSNTDPVAKLLAAYGKLTAGQKRSFKAGI